MTGRIPIFDVEPMIGCGRYLAKAVVGETFEVSATVFREGHDAVAASVSFRDPAGRVRQWRRMHKREPWSDRWFAELTPDAEGLWSFTIEGWSDPIGTWRHTAEVKIPAEIDVDLVFTEGAALLEKAAAALPRGKTAERRLLRDTAKAVRDDRRPPPVRLAAALAPDVTAVMDVYPVRNLVTEDGPYPVRVDRERALYGSWYEFFPRSEGAYRSDDGSWTSGTFQTAAKRLPAIAAMGFDVVYLPPIHPIGRTYRKGANNTLTPTEHDPGVPWAIGSEEGGHDSIHPELGTFDSFDDFVSATRDLGMEVALDLALQASPDHPWVRDHPEWFNHRADGTIAYAENPPKKYQDIYPLNFDDDPEGSYAEMLRIVRLWMDHGVRIFRVDNPHTKPVSFWYRLLEEIRQTDPDVVFLAEAFTKPAMMHALAKIGFGQSYTYFTWRNSKQELYEYFTELRNSAAYMRPNVFVNTPDILHAYLQYGGPAAFKVRAVLAAMLSPTWGVYSGYELYEHVALRPGSEEYLDSEKYQYRPRDWAAYEPGGPREGQSLAPYLTRLNEIRRAHPALHRLRNLRFHWVDNAEIICFSKREPLPDGGEDVVVTVVNVDPHSTREGTISMDMPALGFDWRETFTAHDELSGQTFHWGQFDFVRLDPAIEPAHVLTVRRWGT
jgi:starch synthase (maltosyl-transferring)